MAVKTFSYKSLLMNPALKLCSCFSQKPRIVFSIVWTKRSRFGILHESFVVNNGELHNSEVKLEETVALKVLAREKHTNVNQ